MYFGYYSFYHYFICRDCNCLLFYLFSLNENSLIWTAFLVRIKFEKSKIFTKKQTKCPCRWRRIWPGCDKMMRRNQGLASWQKSETIAGNKGLNRTSGTKEKKKTKTVCVPDVTGRLCERVYGWWLFLCNSIDCYLSVHCLHCGINKAVGLWWVILDPASEDRWGGTEENDWTNVRRRNIRKRKWVKKTLIVSRFKKTNKQTLRSELRFSDFP